MDIIYKEQALELISDRNIEAHMDSVMDGELHRVKRAVQRIIVSMPSAEKTGKWKNIDIIHDRADAKIQDWQQAKRSVCGRWQTKPYLYGINLDPYCPSCGARMEEE